MVAGKDVQARERGRTLAFSRPWKRQRSCPKPSRSSTQDGKTAVSEAARYQHPAVLTLLLDKGADIEAVDRDAWRAVHIAADQGHDAVVCTLVLGNGMGGVAAC